MDMVVPVSVSFYVVLFLISLAQFQVQSFQVHQVPTSPEHKEVFDKCDAFLKPVIERRNACLKEAKDIVDICVNYSTDVEYIIPFILHHLTLGVRTVRLYNNDHRYSWYYHPTIVCLIRSELLILQSWPGDGNGIQGYNHCKTRIDRNLNTSGLWQANLDIDELIILKKTKCLNTFLSQYKTPAVHIRWAMFVPQLPLQDYHFTSIAPDNSLIIPHEMLNTRKKSSLSFKTISRTECVLSYPNPHTIRVKDNCKYGGEKNLIWVDEKYSNSQINHYWGLSMKHFLRKMHRGAGSERSRADPQHYRDTTILFSYSRDVIVDNSFEELYGSLWKELKSICLNCFNLTYFYDYKV